MIDLRASAVSGLAIAVVLTGAWLAALARGEDGSAYGQLLAMGGVVYVVAVLMLRARA